MDENEKEYHEEWLESGWTQRIVRLLHQESDRRLRGLHQLAINGEQGVAQAAGVVSGLQLALKILSTGGLEK
jgi:hypothetical protein